MRRISTVLGLVAVTVAFAFAGTAAADRSTTVTTSQCEAGGGHVEWHNPSMFGMCNDGEYFGQVVNSDD